MTKTATEKVAKAAEAKKGPPATKAVTKPIAKKPIANKPKVTTPTKAPAKVQ